MEIYTEKERHAFDEMSKKRKKGMNSILFAIPIGLSAMFFEKNVPVQIAVGLVSGYLSISTMIISYRFSNFLCPRCGNSFFVGKNGEKKFPLGAVTECANCGLKKPADK